MLTAGIDPRYPARGRFALLCFLASDGAVSFVRAGSEADVTAAVNGSRPAAVAIAAPIVAGSINETFKTRKAEKELRLLQHPSCRNPRFAPLPLPFVAPLALRATAVAGQLEGCTRVLESYPPGAWEFLDLPGGRRRWRYFQSNRYALEPFGICRSSAETVDSPSRLDALLCALTARLHQKNLAAQFGVDSEGIITLPRPPKIDLVALDVDGTLTEVQSPWRHVHQQLGLWEREGESILRRWLSGEISYDRFCALDVGLWKKSGVSMDTVVSILNRIPVRREGVDLLRRLVNRGISVAMISSGFRRVAARIAREAGVEDSVKIIANELVRTPQGETGVVVRVSGDAGSKRNKGSILRRVMQDLGISPIRALAAGDGPSDRQLFERCAQRLLVTKASDLGKILDMASRGRCT